MAPPSPTQVANRRALVAEVFGPPVLCRIRYDDGYPIVGTVDQASLHTMVPLGDKPGPVIPLEYFKLFGPDVLAHLDIEVLDEWPSRRQR